MDYVKLILSSILVFVYYLLFGQESIAKLKKGGISISRNEEEPKYIKAPGSTNHQRTDSSLVRFCSGMCFVITSGSNHLFYRENCVAKNMSHDDFKQCVNQSTTKTSLMKYNGLESFHNQVYLNSYYHIDMLFPENGSIGVGRKNPIFKLDPGYKFIIMLFDKDLFLFVSNPLIVPQTFLTVHPNTSNVFIGLKVSMYPIL